MLPNLPAQPTPLIGRGADVLEVGGLLARSDVRLLTLTGQPASARHAWPSRHPRGGRAAAQRRRCSSTSRQSTMPGWSCPRSRAALAVEESGGGSLLGRLGQYLSTRRLLIVLDNVEQVLAAARDVGELLGQCPDLKVLATRPGAPPTPLGTPVPRAAAGFTAPRAPAGAGRSCRSTGGGALCRARPRTQTGFGDHRRQRAGRG